MSHILGLQREITLRHLLANPSAPYLAVGSIGGVPVLWFRPTDLAQARVPYCNPGVLVRACQPWLWRDSCPLRRHPVTGERYPARVRWAAFRLDLIGTDA